MIIGAATWLLTMLAHGLIIGAVAVLTIPRLSRHPGVRVALWRLALAAPLVTSAIAIASDSIAPRATIDVATPLRPHVPSSWRREEVRVLEDQRLGGPLVRSTIVDDPLAQALASLLCAAALLAAVAGVWRVVRRRRHSIAALGLRERFPVSAAPSPDRLRVSAGERSIRYTGSRRLVSPVALGHDEVCLPIPVFADLAAAEQHGVLLHEIAHLERHDPLWLDLTQFVAALTPWRPLGRRMLRSLRHDTELAADERAVELGAEPTALVAALARFAGAMEREPVPLGVALALDESAIVERAHRILGMRAGASALESGLSRVATAGAWLVVVAAVAILVTLPIPTPADRDALQTFGNPRDTLRVQQLLETPQHLPVTEQPSHARSPIHPPPHAVSSL